MSNPSSTTFLVVHSLRVSALRPVGARQAVRMRVKDAVGRFGEQVAADHLHAAGLVVLERNWRCRQGELDLVALDGDVLVVVEVKTRSSAAFGDPAEAIGPAKAARLRRLAVLWLAAHPDMRPPAVRFDVVAVLRRGPGGLQVRHLPGVL